MNSVEKDREISSSIITYLEEQNALVRAGGYWDCLASARKLSAMLLAEGRSPWLARVRKSEARGDEVFHFPLIPRGVGIARAWTTHYICCCEAEAFDPLAGKPIQLETYSLEVFGEQLPTEVFVSDIELPAYLGTIEGLNKKS